MRLLVVEQDSTRAALLRERLLACGAQTVSLASGVDEGCRLARATAYDAVLVGRPGDHAPLGACARLHADAALRRPPLIVLQRGQGAAATGRTLGAGAAGLLSEEAGVLAWGEALTATIEAARLRRGITLGLVGAAVDTPPFRALVGAGFEVEALESWPSSTPAHWRAAVAASPPAAPPGVPVVPLWRGPWSPGPRRRPLAQLVEAVDLAAGAPARAAPGTGSPLAPVAGEPEARARFIEQARAEVDALAELLRQLATGAAEDGAQELSRRCDLLASRADGEGLDEVAGQASEIARLAREDPDQDTLLGCANGLAALEAALRPTRAVAPPRRELVLLLVDDDPALARQLGAIAGGRSLTVLTARDLSDAATRTATAPTTPDVAFIAAHLVSEPDLAADLRRIPALAATPLVLVASPADVHERLAAIPLEAELVLDRPVSADDLLRGARRLVEDLAGPRRPLLALLGPAPLGTALGEQGFDVVRFEAPESDHIGRVAADALLIDGAEHDAPALLHRLRLDPRLRPVPGLVRCLTDAPDEALAALEAGADDALPAGVGLEEVAARLRSRVERFATLRASSSVDPLTGVAVWRRFEERLDDEIAIAHRTHRPFSVASVELDPVGLELPPRTREALQVAIARHLRQRVRRSDLVGRARGDEFLVLLRECTCDDAKRVVEGILADFRKVRAHGVATAPSFSAGIGSYPDHGNDAPAVLEAARRARLRGRQRGGSAWVQVSSTERRTLPERTGAPRILVVDPDDNVRRMVAFALEQRGFVVDHLPDGAQAVERLLEQPGALPPDLVVLEADLPFVSGYDLLRRLQESSRTRRPRVMMLTSRKAERDVIRAFDLGADDHVGKPFSVPVLVARIRAVLAARDRA